MYSVQLQMIRIKDWNEEQEDPDVDIFNISQNVQDIVIHLEVDELLCCCCLHIKKTFWPLFSTFSFLITEYYSSRHRNEFPWSQPTDSFRTLRPSRRQGAKAWKLPFDNGDFCSREP